jgi:impB/mucB/samB family/IMS family HHH motif
MLAQDSDRDRARSTTEDPNGHVSDEPTRRRKIIHIDMDAFFASVEQRDNPELRGNPIAVGGSRERGVVAAASYEARAFGVRSAMPSVTAKRKCPNLIFVRPRFDVYRAVSLHIRAIFAAYTPIIEPLSLDEAYLDVTENLKGIVSATQIAETIRAKIRTETGLTASAGVSYNKFLAKLASDHRKPDGLFVITPKMGPAFVERLPVEKFHGVGPATAAKMNRLGIKVRPQRADAYLPSAALREAGAILLLDRARRRRTARPSRPDPQVSWCGKYRFRRYLHIRGRMRGAPADHRKGLAHLRGSRDSRAHGDTESEICRFPADHAKPDRSGALVDASRNRAA